ncbi:MAG: DUF3667 domain-containing protein [Gemmatirosa sp.]
MTAPRLDPAAVGTYGPPTPSDSAAPDAAPRCPSCGAERPARFCPECGEARVAPEDFTLRHFASHAFEQFTSVDGALWRTLRTLCLKPGQLTADWIAGRRRGYARPLQLFVLVNVAFFVLLSATGTGFRFRLEQYTHGRVSTIVLGDTTALQRTVARKAAREGITVAEYARRFDAASGRQQSVWLLLAPTVAVLLAAVYARRRLPFVQHLVFAIHFLAFMLLFLACWMGGISALIHGVVTVARAIPPEQRWLWPHINAVVDLANNESVTGYPALAVISTYLFRALRRVHAEAWQWTLGRTAALAWVLPRLFDGYRDLLFAITYYTT